MSKELPIVYETKLEVVDESGNPVDMSIEDFMGELLVTGWKENEDLGVLQPAVVWSDSPYAQFVEFGSGPARPGSTTLPHEGETGSFDEIIRTWIAKKPISIPENEKEKIIKAIKQKIRTEGIDPQPFLRSAVFSVLDEISRDDEWFNQPGNTIKAIAKRIEDKAIDNIEGNGTSYTGALIQSVHSDSVEGLHYNSKTGEYEGIIEKTSSEIPDDVWNDPTLGAHNKKAKYGRR